MHIAEIADVFHDLNPLRSEEIQKVLGADKLQKVKSLSAFSDTVAGGLMHETFFQKDAQTTVKALLKDLQKEVFIPETIIITKNNTYSGTLQVKDLLHADDKTALEDTISDTQYINEQTPFDEIVRLFAQYNLRVLPVVNKEKKPLGIVIVDEILKIIDEENERDENI